MKLIVVNAPIQEPVAANATYTQFSVRWITAKDESRYQALLQVAAFIRLRATTAEVNITYTASVAAVPCAHP
jgi:hypothetical protein